MLSQNIVLVQFEVAVSKFVHDLFPSHEDFAQFGNQVLHQAVDCYSTVIHCMLIAIAYDIIIEPLLQVPLQ